MLLAFEATHMKLPDFWETFWQTCAQVGAMFFFVALAAAMIIAFLWAFTKYLP